MEEKQILQCFIFEVIWENMQQAIINNLSTVTSLLTYQQTEYGH